MSWKFGINVRFLSFFFSPKESKAKQHSSGLAIFVIVKNLNEMMFGFRGEANFLDMNFLYRQNCHPPMGIFISSIHWASPPQPHPRWGENIWVHHYFFSLPLPIKHPLKLLSLNFSLFSFLSSLKFLQKYPNGETN